MTTQPIEEAEKPRSRAMGGRATEMIVASSTTRNCAPQARTINSHGLAVRSRSAAGIPVAAVTDMPTPSVTRLG